MITEALIIRKSGEYDCEVVTKLKIDRMSIFSSFFLFLFSSNLFSFFLGIQRISNLENCISLIDLNLSNNEVKKILSFSSSSSSSSCSSSFTSNW